MDQSGALAWVAEVFEEEPGKITPDTRRDEIAGWDSMGVLALMAGMDNDFDIVLSPEEVRAMKNVGDILQILRRYGKLE